MILSGGLGGFIQGIALSPVLLLKTRVMTDPAFRATGGVLDTAIAASKVGASMIVKEGPLVLFKGMPVFAFKRFADWTTRFAFVELATIGVSSLVLSNPGDVLPTHWKMLSAL